MDDAALGDAIRAGDEKAFEQLIREQTRRLLAVTRRILGNEEDAREAVHEAFISAYRAREQFAGQARPSTWLHRIAVNAALGKLRTRQRRPERAIADLLPRFLPNGQHAQQFTAWTEPADVMVARQETADAVRDAIAHLPESFRVVLLLRDIEELSTEETATILALTPNAVKIRLHRARMALRTLLSERFQGVHP